MKRNGSDVRFVVICCEFVKIITWRWQLHVIGFYGGFFCWRNADFVGIEIGNLLENVRPSLGKRKHKWCDFKNFIDARIIVQDEIFENIILLKFVTMKSRNVEENFIFTFCIFFQSRVISGNLILFQPSSSHLNVYCCNPNFLKDKQSLRNLMRHFKILKTVLNVGKIPSEQLS